VDGVEFQDEGGNYICLLEEMALAATLTAFLVK